MDGAQASVIHPTYTVSHPFAALLELGNPCDLVDVAATSFVSCQRLQVMLGCCVVKAGSRMSKRMTS